MAAYKASESCSSVIVVQFSQMVRDSPGDFVQDVPDRADSWRWPGSPFARRRPCGFGEYLADDAAVNAAAAGDLPDGHAVGGVITDDPQSRPGAARTAHQVVAARPQHIEHDKTRRSK
jgi:hypothetical protein